MSWRVLFATLLVALGVSVGCGIQFGDWLVAHAPSATSTPAQPDAPQEPILDANGAPYTAQPPQPRIDGTLGVPDSPTKMDWRVSRVSLFDTLKDPSVRISRYSVSMSETRKVNEARKVTPVTRSKLPNKPPAAVPPPKVGVPRDLTQRPRQPPGRVLASGNISQQPLIQSIDMPPVQQQPSRGSGQKGWRDTLKRELARCAKTGFFERPTCSWNARNKYCEPNQAWGTISECPSRP